MKTLSKKKAVLHDLCSYSFDMLDRTLNDLQLFLILLTCWTFLKIGNTSFSFRNEAKFPDFKRLLKADYKKSAKKLFFLRMKVWVLLSGANFQTFKYLINDMIFVISN